MYEGQYEQWADDAQEARYYVAPFDPEGDGEFDPDMFDPEGDWA